MNRGGHRENSGRKKKPEKEKAKFIIKSISFSSDKESELLKEIEIYGRGKSFNECLKELIISEINRRKNEKNY